MTKANAKEKAVSIIESKIYSLENAIDLKSLEMLDCVINSVLCFARRLEILSKEEFEDLELKELTVYAKRKKTLQKVVADKNEEQRQKALAMIHARIYDMAQAPDIWLLKKYDDLADERLKMALELGLIEELDYQREKKEILKTFEAIKAILLAAQAERLGKAAA